MKKYGIVTIGCILLLLGVMGCEKEPEEENLQKAEALSIEESKHTYEFVDVEGNEYEAELLDALPKNGYDYSRLIREDGYPYYLDEQGNKISKLGIDVSEYQPEVDWEKVRAAGVEYAMIRVGYRGYGEAGTLVEDAMFRSHIEAALAAGMEVGVYFFSQAITEAEAAQEAEFVLERITDYEIACPVVYDVEEIKYDTARTDDLSAEAFTHHCRIFCDRIKEAGYDTMIYANMKWLAFVLNLEALTDYAIWYADYEPLPQCPYEFSMWQYTETGSIDGIDGKVDLNVWFMKE